MFLRTERPGRGFTLVEILVVVAIIGVLAGILLAALGKVRESARSTQCKSNLHQIYTALELYRQSNKYYYPIAASMPSLGLNDDPRIVDVLAPYAGNINVFHCPSDRYKRFETEGSSYEYNTRLGGRRTERGHFAQILGSENTMVFYDYDEVHGPEGKGLPNSRNYVFVDGHVGGF
jgi:prepilin-type N-terminal cleavage/methylation domain-containing protein/prepilin-type processing-associated H-X9-DG protein